MFARLSNDDTRERTELGNQRLLAAQAAQAALRFYLRLIGQAPMRW